MVAVFTVRPALGREPDTGKHYIWRVTAEERRFRVEAPSISSRLLDMRNLQWVPRIIGLIKQGQPTMIVAGAAHFAGPPSLIKLLALHGYKCEQL